jgi:hypothetical protein
MARGGAGTERKHRGDETAVDRQRPVAHGVDATVQDVQSACCDAAVDRARMQAEIDEVDARDHAFLVLRELSDQGVGRTRSTFATHSVVNCVVRRHAAQPALGSVTALRPV